MTEASLEDVLRRFPGAADRCDGALMEAGDSGVGANVGWPTREGLEA